MSGLTFEQNRNFYIGEVHRYVENALSSNSLKAYKSDWEHFRNWGGDFPSSPEQVATYLSFFAGILTIATLQRRLVSITKAHTLKGYPDPVKSELVKMTFKGIRRIHGKPQSQVSPILKEDLVVMLSHCPDTTKGKRDAALLLLGFCGALRRSELVAVKIEDLEFNAQGIVLTLPRSKTDQTGQGRKIAIPKGRGKICPVNVVNVWIAHLSAESGFVFRSISKGGEISADGLSSRAVSDIIKFYAEKAGLDPRKYSGHSLRSGLCTSAAQHGISSHKIREQTGHKSETMLARYIRDGNLFENNAAGLF